MELDKLPELGKAESSLSLLAPKALPPTGRNRTEYLCAKAVSILENKGEKNLQKNKTDRLYKILQSLTVKKNTKFKGKTQ